MERIETGNPERLEYCSTSGVPGLIFGLMLAAGGYVAFQVPMVSDSPGASEAIGYALIALGVAAATMRHGMILDRASGSIITWFGLAFPWFRRRRPMEAQSVRLGRDKHRHKGMTYIYYPVEVILQKGRLCVGSVTDNVKAWAMSQEMADFLGVPLVDESAAI